MCIEEEEAQDGGALEGAVSSVLVVVVSSEFCPTDVFVPNGSVPYFLLSLPLEEAPKLSSKEALRFLLGS